MMNSDELSSENVLVTSEDLQGFTSAPINSKEIADEANHIKIDSISKEEHHEYKASNSMSSNDQDLFDVIVVGAGISGLSAAYFMKKKHPNLKILIVEAKDRVGGRTQTIELKCTEDGQKGKWDVGGQWVTDDQINITKILKELNIETYKQFDSGKKIMETKGKLTNYSTTIPNVSIFSLVDLQLMLTKINSNAKKVSPLHPYENHELAKRLDSLNLEGFMYSSSFNSTSRAISDAAIKVIYGLEPNQINALFGVMYVSSGGSFEKLSLPDKGCAQEKRIKGGAQQISEKLLASVMSHSNEDKFLLNTALVEVNQNINNDEVSIVTTNTKTKKNQEFKAKKIILSIPINQYIHVKFTPDLAYFKKNVFKFSQMGHLMKYIVTYKNPFWRQNGFSGEVLSDGSIMSLNIKDFKDSMPTSGPNSVIYDATLDDTYGALLGFIGGKQATEWADQSPEIRKKEIIESLVRYFGPQAGEYLDYTEKNWADEEYLGGCPVVNVCSGGVMKDFVRATREQFYNLHFCGTESAIQWQGYMDGAVESGERAANEVLYSLFKTGL